MDTRAREIRRHCPADGVADDQANDAQKDRFIQDQPKHARAAHADGKHDAEFARALHHGHQHRIRHREDDHHEEHQQHHVGRDLVKARTDRYHR